MVIEHLVVTTEWEKKKTKAKNYLAPYVNRGETE